VTLFGVSPEALTVNPALPVTSIAELITYLKANPGKVNFGNTGPGGLPHLSSELFAQLSHTQIVHVPYHGTAPSVADVISGHIQGTIDSVISQLGAIKQGQLRVLGTTLKQRSPALPDVPAINEVLPGYEATSWMGLFAAPGTSPELVAKLQKDVRTALATPEVRDRMTEVATVPDGRSPEEFAAFIKADIERWRKVGEQGHIKIEE
jgi:tripartite-type tricarboxylate transporter receptor subunit TctC